MTTVRLLACLVLVLAGCRTNGTAAPDPGEPPADTALPLRLPPAKTTASTSDATGAPGDDKSQKWDVEAAPGPKQKVTIDTDEGTWMSVDVSPDGKTLAFDLLGDIYVLPITGGTARALTSTVAWDMQPRFSPDGSSIAFTSDRDGADNIWVMSTTGGDLHQVTTEDFRLLNSPAWSPDGSYIVARKHFTAERSLGSGELWLYHVAGGKGVQLTEKPNDQKDVGEPAFAPGGRFVYFSKDSTPGDVFEYNKDPYAGIYAIERLDLEEGRTETFVSGAGGAARPTPSPDGEQLAFVRRIGHKTALVVHDLNSGAERAIAYDLDRDMQETWAIHGVYPAMAWTPDSAEIVYWAGGKLRRVDVATTNAREIPFRVQHERTVTAALRSPVEVHPSRFHTKMIRNATVAPDGRAVVFQALGHLWIRELPSGKPRRLTSDTDFEFQPSFSRDGKQIVYVTWNDDALGRVKVIGRGGGRGRTITGDPGHYRDPTFSPDGKQVVFRRTTGDTLVSKRYSHDPGLYVVASAGGTPRLVSRAGADPHFGRASDRVFFKDFEGGKDGRKTVLRSIALSRAELRTHVTSESATEFRVAPDGRWLAFREGFEVFIAPMPATGDKPIELGPKAEGLPIAEVSKDAGEFIHWSGDSRELWWSLGPQLFRRPLTDAFGFLAGKDATLPPPPERGIDIGFDVDADLPKGRVALVGGRVVTMRGDEVFDDAVVLIEGNRISAVGRHGDVAVPADAVVFDTSGTTIIPGLVDVHAHGPQGVDEITPQRNWLHDATLTFGVTTVHDPSNDTGEIFAAAELARAGLITAPRIFSTGTILYGAKAPFRAQVDSLDDARRHLRRMQAVGAFSVKSYNQPRRNQRQQILAAARELGMMVVPEGGSLFQHNMNMIVDGHTGIEHATPIARGYRDVIQLWSHTAVGYTPTIGVGYGGLWGENYWYAHTRVYEHPRLRTFVPPENFESRSRRRTLAGAGDWNHFAIARFCKQLADAGVSIQLGAHGQREGLAAHWELWMLVQGGMTPHEALRAGTLAGARYLGLDRDIGSIEAGKLADLAVIDGDVLRDIRSSDKVRMTVVNGRVYDAASMDELAPRRRKRAQPYWQRAGG